MAQAYLSRAPVPQNMVPLVTNAEEHQKVVAIIDKLMLKPNRSQIENDRLEALSLLVENYEKKAFAKRYADPIEVLKYQMEQMGINANQLANELQMGRGRISELLNRKRSLTLDQIRLISDRLRIPVDQLIPRYSVEAAAHSVPEENA